MPQPDEEVLGLVPVDDDFPPPRHFHALGLQAGVRVLQTMLVSIDRQHQAVLLPRGKVSQDGHTHHTPPLPPSCSLMSGRSPCCVWRSRC